MDGKIVQWKHVQKDDMVLIDDSLVLVEEVRVVQKPWGEHTTFTAVDITYPTENGGRVTVERKGDMFTAVTTRDAVEEDRRDREREESFNLWELRAAMRNRSFLDASNDANYDAVVRRIRNAREARGFSRESVRVAVAQGYGPTNIRRDRS